MIRSALLVAALLLPATGFACRCAQQPLAAYFEKAGFVAMARLVSFEETADARELEFELAAAPYKGGEPGQGKGSIVRVRTAVSTASCGIQPDIDAVYVVFGYSTDAGSGAWQVDSCSGTRVHLSADLDEPVGFVDVPARFVAGQLNALLGRDVLGDVAASAPNPDDPENDSLIGLLDLKAFPHGGHVDVFAEPDPNAARIGVIRSYGDVESREVGYEVPAAVVYAKLPGWYRVRSAGGRFGWIEAEGSHTWFPYAELPVRRLAYLTSAWSGLAWPEAGAGIPVRIDISAAGADAEYPVEVLESIEIGGMPFFRVEILGADPCSGEARKVRAAGWVPGYGRTGEPNVWYYSRGC